MARFKPVLPVLKPSDGFITVQVYNRSPTYIQFTFRTAVFRQRMRSSSATRGPLLANTTLTVLRFFGVFNTIITQHDIHVHGKCP